MEQKKGAVSKKAWLIIFLLFLLTVISNADKAVIGFASVSIMKELGLNAEQWGVVGSVFFLLYSLSAVLGGSLADKIGAKKVIAGMVAVWSIVQFSTIFVNSFAYLLVTRIVLGAGEGPSYSLAMTAASKYLPKEKLGIGLTLVSIGGPLGVAISAPLLMHLIMNYGWRSAFIATGAVGFIWIIVWLWAAKEKAVTQGESAPEERASIVNAAVQSETKFTSVLFSKNFIFVALCGFGTYWSFTIGLNWLPNYLENVRKLSEETLSIVVALPWIMITVSQITFSAISDRIYHKTQSVVKGRIFVLGPVMAAGAVSYLLGTMVSSNILAIALLSLGLTFGCITLVMGPAILVDLVSPKHQGKIQGWFMALTSLGGIAGPYFTGWLIERSASQAAGFHHAFQVCGLILFVFGGLVWLAVRPEKYEHSDSIKTNPSEALKM
ncbi:MFS transporter [Aeromicrobium ponti]|uniref:Sugar phosphate permease n=1 Tax=Cytobacillus oceanisediminis TaxID=665099 RepID=A0A562J9A3_9BACI|nr:MFS transporter [Cytobacillus oceanisediminis]TWH79680.1 sugar phosphate permease [Cytobacillus oceanisediminis]